ncbi:MAG: ABC transporter permease [Chloroflexi bacterium]|nr:ABC transporter permease [Chloroflexota bacterium]
MVRRGSPAPGTELLRRLRRSRASVAGAVVILVFTLVAVFAAALAPYDPIQTDTSVAFGPPSVLHWFGTDNLGRDILSRIVHGARISLWIGIISVAIGAAVGTVLGLLAGYYARVVDSVIMRLTDAMLAFPGILLALIFVAALGSNLVNLMIAVGISSVPRYARLVRGSVLSAKENVYVEAARAIGCDNPRIMFRHILPNVIAPVIVVSTLGVAAAILAAASLSFLGLGIQPPTPEWGAMLSGGRDYLRTAWWITVFPGLAITLVVLSTNMLGDGLRDALDPRLKT